MRHVSATSSGVSYRVGWVLGGSGFFLAYPGRRE
jgi:hypothetical protein